ncbi:NAD(P)-binding protein [Auricularia subglabra TFB-10046 SS5]|nr:NAD(P)-binding protein [Auricularia subglabra TFB-10046 SS5]
MVLSTNERFIFQAAPNGIPIPGETTRIDRSSSVDLATVPLRGGFLRELVAFGLEAHMRLMMQPNQDSGMKPGDPLIGQVVCKILRSEHAAYPAGTYVRHDKATIEKFAVVETPLAGSWERLDNDYGMPWSKFLGGAGMPGRTAYYGYRLLTDTTSLTPAKKGEKVFISSAAGPHGSLLVQLFHQLGLTVIGSAGSQEKVDYLKTLGCDIAFNYKDTRADDVLKREGPIDIYWDNVGGETLETAIANMSTFGRIVSCGWTSAYNSDDSPLLRSLGVVMYRSITLYGFFNYDFKPWYEADFQRAFVPRIASGELQYKEHIVHGMNNAEQALVEILSGANFGKTVVVMEG